jgi:nicotinamidase-related amidase
MKKALLIVDMSNDFVHDNGGLTVGKPGQDVVPYIVELADEFLKNGDVVVVAMDAHEEQDDHFSRWPQHNIVGTWGQELYGELKTWADANVEKFLYTPKGNYNAFFETGLAQKLRDEHQVEEVHVVGVCSDICDFATIAGADAHGFKTVIHKRGIATFTHNLPAFQSMLKEGYTPQDVFIEMMKVSFHTEVVE